MSQLKRILIMAGGTGGHVFPGLAVANDLRQRGIEVHWLGTTQGIEAKVVPQAKIAFHTINIKGIRGKGIKNFVTAPYQIVSAIAASHRVIKKLDPDVVIGMGGFTSGPGGVATWLARRPLFIHEQNARAGLTNKLLSYLAKKVFIGFPDSFARSSSKIMMTGNPVRAELAGIPIPTVRFQNRANSFRLLVLGGSLGALALNKIIPYSVARLDKSIQIEILHQTGQAHLEKTKAFYHDAGLIEKLDANVIQLVPFIDNMAHAYAWADMVICRAGALTVAELCMVGLGAIFVPFPFAVDDHQTANANYMVRNKAALCIQQADLTEICLAENLTVFANSVEKRLAMANAAYQLRHENVTEKIFKVLSEVI